MSKTTRQLALTSSIALALGVGTGFSAAHQIASGQDVDTRNGTVTLTGSIDSIADTNQVGPNNGIVPGDRSAAAAKIERANERVELAASDSWTTAKVNASLMLTQEVDGFEIAAATTDGVVSLSGAVDNTAERDLVVRVAQGIRGVRRVEAGGLRVSGSNSVRPSKRTNHQGATT